MKKVGLLLPKSTYYFGIGYDIFQGLKSNLKRLDLENLKIITENIGFGADKQQSYRAAEKLILDEEVDILVAYIGHRTAELLRPLLLATNKILIVLDAGANLPQEWPICPNIIYHSLHNALGASLAAQLATKKGYHTGAMITGYYDGGYLQTYSLSKSFTNSGGTISFNHATGYKQEDFSMEPLKEHLINHPNVALLSLFSGDYVQWYFEKINQLFPNKNLPIFLTPFGLEETMLHETICPSKNIYGIASWSHLLDNEENKAFKDALNQTGKKPNLFSLLGWEVTVLLNQIINLLETHSDNIQQVISALNHFEFDSPRGKITFYDQYNYTLAPLYEVTIIADENERCALQIQSAIEATLTEFEKMHQQELEGVTSAWYNSYVCI
ncbi:ABC transporter substrate-binding protein [Flavobacterium sp.]|uniref:ABC transporter substrate-binding protein n=1 Tax=Flavobacterium sp. TaxID=239 RepID=UPI003D0AC3F1